MKKKTGIIIGAAALLLGIILGLTVSAVVNHNRDKREESDKPTEYAQVYFGDTSLDNYTIISHKIFSEKAAKDELSRLIEEKCGYKVDKKIFGGKKEKTIRLICDKKYTGEKIIISNGKIVLYGTDKNDLVKTVDAFANMYLGWAFAGEEREHVLENGEVKNPNDVLFRGEPWMVERETITCLWKTNVARGQYFNTQASLKSEILTYSDDQLYEYVKMLKACGFTGVQVTDMCSAWAQYSGYEFVHDRLRFIADAAHSLGMKFTLWVWAAEFNGYGWEDDSVVYADYENYSYSFECPEAYETFVKYYTIYSELADCSDRVIMHFDDPSNVHNTVEVAKYAELFRSMVREINPDIDFGVSDYTNKYDRYVIAQYLGSDVTFYAGAVTTIPSWHGFRGSVKDTGAKLGIWSWNLCEREIDQLAEMNVNANVIKNVYLTTANDGDSVLKPSYWSEMDSYHIANIFSLYCAGHLLQDPNLSSEELLRDAATALVGNEYGDDLYEILNIIQIARSGDTWDTFKWSFQDEYLRTSDSYPYEEIYSKCLKYLPVLEEMMKADLPKETIPIPVSQEDVLSIVHTHLMQIEKFSEFRINLSKLEEKAKSGASKEILLKDLEDISTPIPQYDALLGVWGQTEALSQFSLLQKFCKKYDIEMPMNGLYTYKLKQYIYSEICAYQKNRNKVLYYGITTNDIWANVVGVEALKYVQNELVEDGLIELTSDGAAYLVNWEEFVE